MFPYVGIVVVVVFFLVTALKVLNEYERGVIFSAGPRDQRQGARSDHSDSHRR